MAASKKRRVADGGDDSSDDNSDANISDAEEISESEVQVDFEARSPDDADFHGIQRLLQQLFLKAHVDVSQLADLLIGQNNHVTSVIKQCLPEEMEMDDDDEADKDVIFGVFSIVNLMENKELSFNKEIQNYILNHCKDSCKCEEFTKLKEILEDSGKPVGLILSERFLNIPAQISLQLYNALGDDMRKGVEEKKPYNFSYYMLISKICTDKNRPEDEEGVNYANPEEELFYEDAIQTFDFSVAEEQDSGLTGRWGESDMEWQPKRRVMLFPAEKWGSLLNKLKNEFAPQ